MYIYVLYINICVYIDIYTGVDDIHRFKYIFNEAAVCSAVHLTECFVNTVSACTTKTVDNVSSLSSWLHKLL